MNANNGNGGGHSNGNAATKKPVAIETRLMHVAPHLDEVCADMLLASYGEKLFPGIRTAGLKFSENPPNLTDEEWDAFKTVPFGSGGNTRFNEHGKGGQERQEETCCTTLVADYLEKRHDPVIRPIIDAVLRFDTTKNTRPAELPELMKLAYRHMPTLQESVVKWAQQALHAIHQQLLFSYGPSCRPSLINIFEKNTEKYSDHDVVNRMRQTLAGSQNSVVHNGNNSIMELANIIDCMNRVGRMSTEDIEEWVVFILDWMYQDQMDFSKAIDEVNKTGFKFRVPAIVNSREVMIPAVLVRTESKHAVKAARHRSTGGAKITIIRNNKGNFQIFTDSTAGLNLTNLMGMLRWLELSKNQNGKPAKHIGWSVLSKEGDFEGSKFYFFKLAGQVLNGSHSHPGVPASEICTQAILECVGHAFHPKEFGIWRADRGISREDAGLPALPSWQPNSQPKNQQPQRLRPEIPKQVKVIPVTAPTSSDSSDEPDLENLVKISFEGQDQKKAEQEVSPPQKSSEESSEAAAS